ncbi:beta-ketoacyl synthase N-terminal-like domain-containing protein [Motiliproteus sp. MSK22-1]|uniref:beta-ketoacyl synthase N-terminal-like domain-containing protein n=1 Tax=Motiliproteus sp. MSK22-1 TaxID=1897630 RepID=UPI0009780AA4|nr:beta-ketoacyl synthase N-terminal-like domain-containing protein [Motiliproteus sp. MSK22-1]OMH29132.1 hypothetical protein BGP75_20490 [Motiliproteus sp. MSK22-1]
MNSQPSDNDIVVTQAFCELPNDEGDVYTLSTKKMEGGESSEHHVRFLPEINLSSLDRKKSKRHTKLSYRVSLLLEQLLESSGLQPEVFSGPDSGFVSGSGYGCMSTTQGIHTTLRKDGPRKIDAIEFAKSTHSYPLSINGIKYQLLGPSVAIVSSEVAGVDAIQCAADWIKSDRCKRVLVVAYESFSPLLADHVLTVNRELNGCYSFIESISVLLLERRADVESRGGNILATIDGIKTFGGSGEDLKRQLLDSMMSIWRSRPSNSGVICCSHRNKKLCDLENDVLTSFSEDRSFQCDSGSKQLYGESLGASALLDLVYLLNSPRKSKTKDPDHWIINCLDTRRGGGVIGLTKGAEGFRETL